MTGSRESISPSHAHRQHLLSELRPQTDNEHDFVNVERDHLHSKVAFSEPLLEPVSTDSANNYASVSADSALSDCAVTVKVISGVGYEP